MKYYIGAENLFFKPSHPFYADRAIKVNLVYDGYRAFGGRQPSAEDMRILDEEELVFGYQTMHGYKFGTKKACGDDFVPAECATEAEAEGLFNSYIKKFYTDRNHPIVIYLGDVFTYSIDEEGKKMRLKTLTKGTSQS